MSEWKVVGVNLDKQEFKIKCPNGHVAGTVWKEKGHYRFFHGCEICREGFPISLFDQIEFIKKMDYEKGFLENNKN